MKSIMEQKHEHSSDIPSMLILSPTPTDVQCYDKKDVRISLEKSNLLILFVPVVLVPLELVSRKYTLYLFENNQKLAASLKTIQQNETDAIILVGTETERTIYMIENEQLLPISPKKYFLNHIHELIPAIDGKVLPGNNDRRIMKTVLCQSRLACARGNEAEIAGTRTGKNVFSTSFSPCNPMVGRRKNDQQFVLHHAFTMNVSRDTVTGKFLESVEDGGHADFLAIMQNPKVEKSKGKAPFLVGGLMVELQSLNVKRINIPEGYHSIACINGTTIILSEKMDFFSTEDEKQALIKQYEKNIQHVSRKVDMDDINQLIPFSETKKEIKIENTQKASAFYPNPYKHILQGIEKLEQSKNAPSLGPTV